MLTRPKPQNHTPGEPATRCRACSELPLIRWRVVLRELGRRLAFIGG